MRDIATAKFSIHTYKRNQCKEGAWVLQYIAIWFGGKKFASQSYLK